MTRWQSRQEAFMSNSDTGKQSRISSGQFSTLKEHSSPDGGIEYVFDETTSTLEESSNVESAEQRPAPEREKSGPPNFMAIGGILLAFLLVGGGIVYAMQDSKESIEEEDSVEETASFKPYSGSTNKPEPKQETMVRRAAASSEDDLPEELRGLDVGSDDEVIVLEEIHPEDVEDEPALNAQGAAAVVRDDEYVPRSPKTHPLDLDEIRRDRGIKPKQRELLRQMNRDLDNGKLKPFDPGPLPRGLRPHRVKPPMHYSPDIKDIRARAIQHNESVAAEEAAKQEGAAPGKLGGLADPSSAGGPSSTQ